MLAAAAALALLAGPVHPGARARPAECSVLPGERGANVWERAKTPELRRYCDLLASASAKLAPGSRMVPEVPRLADLADGLVPGRAAPAVLKGRALSELDRHPEALASLRAAGERDPRALDDPLALLALARSLAFTGDAAAAREAYRALLPRADALSLRDRGIAYLGAGTLSMAEGPASLGETIAILRQARRESQDLLRAASTFALALALDRSGATGEAMAVLAEGGPLEAPRVMHDPRVVRVIGAEAAGSDGRAIEALSLEAAAKGEAARAAWQAYAGSRADLGVWAAYARARAGAPARPAPRPPQRSSP